MSERWLAAALLLVACGGSEVSGDGGNDGAMGTDGAVDVVNDLTSSDVADSQAADGGPPTGRPPPPAIDAGPPTANVFTFAMQTVFLGETTRTSNVLSTTAWKSFGYNVDLKTTAAQSNDVCTLAQGAPKSIQVDGTSGIDNSWGANLLPILQSASSVPNFSQLETQIIDSGEYTWQLQVVGLSDDPKQNANGLTAQIFTGGPYPNGPPAFDANTDWPVLTTSLSDGQTIGGGAKVKLPQAYVAGGTFVSGPFMGPLVFVLSFQGVLLPLTIHAPIVTFDHTAHADAMNGTVAGVLDVMEFIAALKAVAGRISKSLCGSAFDGIAQQFKQCVEILNDGTNVANVSCTAISIGLGFNAKLVANPTKVVQPAVPPPDPCGD